MTNFENSANAFLPSSVCVKKYVNPATKAAITMIIPTIGLATNTRLNAAWTAVAIFVTVDHIPIAILHAVNTAAAAEIATVKLSTVDAQPPSLLRILPIAELIPETNILTKFSAIFSTTGIKLPSQVLTVSISSCIDLSTSPPPPKAVVKFSQAAFIELNEPSIVVLASFAVVPV